MVATLDIRRNDTVKVIAGRDKGKQGRVLREQRNAYFLEHPKRAGQKIWGKERVPSVFAEEHNCKDPMYQFPLGMTNKTCGAHHVCPYFSQYCRNNE